MSTLMLYTNSGELADLLATFGQFVEDFGYMLDQREGQSHAKTK